MEPIKEYSRFTRQVGYVIVANLATLLLGFVQLPLLTKGLGARLYGAWGLVEATVSFIAPLALLGIAAGIVRFLAAETDKNKIREDFFSSLFITVLISGIVFMLFLIFLSDYLASSVFKDAELSIYVKIASIIIPVTCLAGIINSYLTAFRKIGLMAIFTIIQTAVCVGFIAISIFLGYKLTGVIIARLSASLVFNIILLFIITKQIGFKFPKFSQIKSYLSYGLPLMPTSAILWVIASSDRYMISYFLGVKEAGIYSASYIVGWYTVFLIAPITRLLFPTVAKSYDEQKLDETRNYLKYSLRYFMMIAIPSAFGLSILAMPILRVLTTSEFLTGNTVVPFIAVSGLFYGIYEICIYVLHLVKKTKLVFMLLVSAALLNIALNLVLIPPMGILGAAVATLVAYGVLFILVMIVTRRYLKFDLSMPFVLKSVFSAAIMTLCIWLINPESIAPIVASVFLGVILYFGVLLLIRGLSREERLFFMDFLKEHIGYRRTKP